MPSLRWAWRGAGGVVVDRVPDRWTMRAQARSAMEPEVREDRR
jgi:hypothetical protein